MDREETELRNVMPKPVFEFNFSILMLFRCLRRERAEQFQNGEVYFGSPQQWVNWGTKGLIGQGDILEGTFLSTQTDDNSELICNLKKDPDLEFFDQNGFTFFRRKSILDLRCLCLYGLRNDVFQKEIAVNGQAKYHAQVSKKYFSTFAENKTREEFEAANPKDQSVVVLISNPSLFFYRIRTFLLSLGVKEEEIIISPVEYLDKYVRLLAAVPPPKELLLKDLSFKKQSEVRIIINSSSPKYLEYMRQHNNILSVGSLADITEIYDNYYDDMSVERWGNRSLMISLPKSNTAHVNDFSFSELEDLLLNILRGTVKITGVDENLSTWDEKLKYLSDLFYSKYGVQLHVDEDRNVFMYNLSPELLEQSHEKHKKAEESRRFEIKIEDLIKAGKNDEAFSECLGSIEDSLVCGIANYYLGKIYLMRGQFEEAVETFYKSYLYDYKRIESLDGIASIYFQQTEYEKAIAMYNAIQDEKGYDDRIWCNIGICYIHLKQYNKAIEYFDKGISADKNDAFLFYNKGVSCYMMQQYDNAKRYMEEAIKLDPDNEFYRREYAKCFSNNDEQSESAT